MGGPEAQFIGDLLREFMLHCQSEASLGDQSATLNVVYHLPGSIYKPTFRGGEVEREIIQDLIDEPRCYRRRYHGPTFER